MSLEILLQRKLVSENTARELLRSIYGRFFRRMKGPDQEALDAADNLDLDAELAKLTSQFDNSNTGNGNGNGKRAAISGRAQGGRNE